jgi:hypothetical protein
VRPWRPTPTDNHDSVMGWTLVSDARAYGGDYLQATSTPNNYESFTLSLPKEEKMSGTDS